MSSPKYTKIEITPEAYLALESETILQSKTLKRLASELILKGVSTESLNFSQRAKAMSVSKKFDEDRIERLLKDIGISAIKLTGSLLEIIKEKLVKEGYLGAMLYVAQNTASMERDELHRILTICAYHNISPSIAGDILVKLNEIDSKPFVRGSSRKEEWTRQTRPASRLLFTPHKQ